MIRLDAGGRTVLVVCTECPGWRSLQMDYPAAHLAAAEHADRTHADSALAHEFRRRATRRGRR